MERIVGGDGSLSLVSGQNKQTIFCEMLYLTTAFAEQEADAEIADKTMATNLQLMQQSLFWQQTTR